MWISAANAWMLNFGPEHIIIIRKSKVNSVLLQAASIIAVFVLGRALNLATWFASASVYIISKQRIYKGLVIWGNK